MTITDCKGVFTDGDSTGKRPGKARASLEVVGRRFEDTFRDGHPRHEDDRRRRDLGHLADDLKHLDAVELRHPDVRDHEIGAQRLDLLYAIEAGVRRERLNLL